MSHQDKVLTSRQDIARKAVAASKGRTPPKNLAKDEDADIYRTSKNKNQSRAKTILSRNYGKLLSTAIRRNNGGDFRSKTPLETNRESEPTSPNCKYDQEWSNKNTHSNTSKVYRPNKLMLSGKCSYKASITLVLQSMIFPANNCVLDTGDG